MENLALTPATRAVATRMEHVHVGVASIDASADWYRRAFGFEVRYDDAGPRGRCAHVGTDSFYVAMSEIGRKPRRGDIYHFGFTVDDLDAFKARLRREGISVGEEAGRKEGDAVYLYDPDGHEIEVVAYRPEYVYR